MLRACWQNYVVFPSNFLKRVWTRAFSLWGLMVGLLSSKYHKKDKKWTKELISTQPPFLPFAFSLRVRRSDSWQLGFKKFHPTLYPTPDLTVKCTAPAWLWWSHREELLTMGSLRLSADCVRTVFIPEAASLTGCRPQISVLPTFTSFPKEPIRLQGNGQHGRGPCVLVTGQAHRAGGTLRDDVFCLPHSQDARRHWN